MQGCGPRGLWPAWSTCLGDAFGSAFVGFLVFGWAYVPLGVFWAVPYATPLSALIAVVVGGRLWWALGRYRQRHH